MAEKCYQVTQLLKDPDGSRYRVFVDSTFASSRHEAIVNICEEYDLRYESLRATLADAVCDESYDGWRAS